MLKIPAQKPNADIEVLIIDAQALVHTVIRGALLDAGIKQVKSAHNAYSALRLCQTTRFDMVLIAFDVKSDKDGFNLLEEMKYKGYITKTTCVIFLSADTSQGLVNCVVEMEPTDFWVKPLDRSKVIKRIHHILTIEKKLYALRYYFDQNEYPKVIYYAERQLEDPSLTMYYPHINRLIGKSLFNIKEYQAAQEFYQKLAKSYSYAWVQLGLAATLLKQNKIDEATELTTELLQRDDTKFATYDLLAEYHIDNEDYQQGYEIIQEATKLAPRSIERNRKSWNLARLNHDKVGQYLATKNIAKYAKNSIHDSPDLQLNVIRSGLDLAATLSDTESDKVLVSIEKSIERLKQEFGSTSDLADQLTIIEVRRLNLRQNKKQAEQVMLEHSRASALKNFEDNLDKVKAFHEVGLWEQSMRLLEQMKDDVENDSFTGKVLSEYLEQESKERQDIRYSPKELGEMASAYYKNKRYKPAYNLLCQAAQLSPNNPNITITLLKVLAILAEEDGLSDEETLSVEKCLETLEEATLSEVQQTKVNEYNERIDKAGVLQD
ncbi:response regulator [Paraglaciecola arctica]|uniref:Response regulator receiver protein n=1 Tax=Paraglaciecola arctica BSs20135 TaxID=493475 RepID=K6YNX4_9ALTE|nr:response regulator [Paraglaciecola arctica]GAC19867.1 response regulator receiver protein [Paraglaciecola arctica BSs20135]